MSQYVTDTHALCWHLTEDSKLSSKAKKIFQKADSGIHQILIPSIVLIEMVYLAEKGRISDSSLNQVLELIDIIGGSYDEAPLNRDTVKALQNIPRADVPDMPDRIITATAYQLDLPLITKDDKIKNSGVISVIW
ncbi:MAG: type II toxin-antitoxin system VapC family toxin [Candidatus Thorarchaeota archaeon]